MKLCHSQYDIKLLEREKLHAVHQPVPAAAVAQQLTVALHGAQPAAHRLDIVLAVQAEGRHQVLAGHQAAGIGQHRHNELPAGDGGLVFFPLALGKWVLGDTGFLATLLLASRYHARMLTTFAAN